MAFLGVFGGILFLLVGVVQIYIGFLGIEYHLGIVWAWIAIVIALGFRIMLPLTIGTFFGAISVMGWPWYGALALAAPGLLFIAPALVTAALATLSDKKNDEYKASSRPNVSRPVSKDASSDELLKQGFKVVKKAKDDSQKKS